LTSEDDQWLWEPVWTLNPEHPEAAEAEKVALVRQVVLGLAEQNRVTLWRGQWPDGIVEPLSDEGRERIATEVPPWNIPECTDQLVIIQIASKPT
jgi:hypothetical protein